MDKKKLVMFAVTLILSISIMSLALAVTFTDTLTATSIPGTDDATLNIGEQITFQISGGVPPYNFVSGLPGDNCVVKVSDNGVDIVTLQANSASFRASRRSLLGTSLHERTMALFPPPALNFTSRNTPTVPFSTSEIVSWIARVLRRLGFRTFTVSPLFSPSARKAARRDSGMRREKRTIQRRGLGIDSSKRRKGLRESSLPKPLMVSDVLNQRRIIQPMQRSYRR